MEKLFEFLTGLPPNIIIIILSITAFTFIVEILNADEVEKCFWTSSNKLFHSIFSTIYRSLGLMFGVIIYGSSLKNADIIVKNIFNIGMGIVIIILILTIIKQRMLSLKLFKKWIKGEYSPEIYASSINLLAIIILLYPAPEIIKIQNYELIITLLSLIFAAFMEVVKKSWIISKKYYIKFDKDNRKWYIKKGIQGKKVLLQSGNTSIIRDKSVIDNTEIYLEEGDK
ncbi:MAG TPA: hypothetical protein DCP90_05780 [Clostridiales bacterium]|nr:MAG: hypothetical protein A2Y22_04895 [Clostridiales bacterium GWD2_32_59]HAN10103.1 hypothetical protein [Clostridiales bacterium]